MPRFLRPSGRSQRLREGVLGCEGHAALAACRVSCGLWAARNACGKGRWGREGHAALCGMPRFLRPSGRSQRLRGGVRWGVRGMPRFAACRVSCGLWAARNACAVREAGAWGHAAFCNLSRFLRPSGRSQRLREGALGRGGMPRFAAYRVSCGLWAARNACAYCAAAQGFGALPQTPAGG